MAYYGPKADEVLEYVKDIGPHGVSASDITFDLDFKARLNVYPILQRLMERGQIERLKLPKGGREKFLYRCNGDWA